MFKVEMALHVVHGWDEFASIFGIDARRGQAQSIAPATQRSLAVPAILSMSIDDDDRATRS
jgi:hypothetical protein